MSGRGRDKDTERSRDPYIAGGSFQASSDPLAHGHSAVTLLSGGGFGLPRISVMAREALATGEYGPARHAAMTWYTNKPYLEELARSLDPEDDMVARAQALLDEMAPLESRLPNLVELAFGLEQSAKARAHWLARLGRAESHAATPAAAPAIPEVRSPLRPENIKPELGWSEIAAGALGGVGVGWAALASESSDPLQRGIADMIEHALDSPEYSTGFLVGGIGGASAAFSDSQQSVVDLAKLVYDLLAARFRGGDLGMLKALRDKVMGLIGAGKQIPGALKALADRWNDGSDPYAQGAFQGTVVGYIATQVAIIIVSSMTVPVVGPYADVVAALKLVTSPVEGIVEVAAAARAARGVGSMTRAEHAVDDLAAGERTLARGERAAADLTPREGQTGHVTGAGAHGQNETPRTVRIYAAGQAPKTEPWRTNPGGVVRSPEEALAIATAHGVVVPDDIQLFFKDPKVLKLDPDTYAVYFARDLQPGSTLRWTDLLNRFDNVGVRVSSEVLSSDEAIVAVIAHEMHELNNLRRLFEESGGAMSGERFARLVNRGIKGNLHDHAWDVADELVRRMRAADGVKP